MKKKKIISIFLIILTITNIIYIITPTKNLEENNQSNKIAMYLLDSENGNVVEEVNDIELNYILDTTKQHVHHLMVWLLL